VSNTCASVSDTVLLRPQSGQPQGRDDGPASAARPAPLAGALARFAAPGGGGGGGCASPRAAAGGGGGAARAECLPPYSTGSGRGKGREGGGGEGGAARAEYLPPEPAGAPRARAASAAPARLPHGWTGSLGAAGAGTRVGPAGAWRPLERERHPILRFYS